MEVEQRIARCQGQIPVESTDGLMAGRVGVPMPAIPGESISRAQKTFIEVALCTAIELGEVYISGDARVPKRFADPVQIKLIVGKGTRADLATWITGAISTKCIILEDGGV